MIIELDFKLIESHPDRDWKKLFFQYSSSAVVAIGYYGEDGHSNTPILLWYDGTTEPAVSDLVQRARIYRLE